MGEVVVDVLGVDAADVRHQAADLALHERVVARSGMSAVGLPSSTPRASSGMSLAVDQRDSTNLDAVGA